MRIDLECGCSITSPLTNTTEGITNRRCLICETAWKAREVAPPSVILAALEKIIEEHEEPLTPEAP